MSDQEQQPPADARSLVDHFFDVDVAPLTVPQSSPAATAPAGAVASHGRKTYRGGKGPLLGKRHKAAKEDAIAGITKPGIRRLARRAGVKRIAGDLYAQQRKWVRAFLRDTLRDAATVTECARRRTVTVADVVFALRRQGITLYAGVE